MANKHYKQCLESFVEIRLEELKKIKGNNKETQKLLKIGQEFGYFSIENLSKSDISAAIFISSLQKGNKKPIFDVRYDENGKIAKVGHKARLIINEYGEIYEFPSQQFIKYNQLKKLLKRYL